MQPTPTAFVKTLLSAWSHQVALTNQLLSKLNDDILSPKISPRHNPGSNPVNHILGQLIASQDQLFPLFGICCSIFPHYASIPPIPPAQAVEMRLAWNNVTIQLAKSFKQMHTKEWFRRPAATSPYPSSKFNILLAATNDIACFRGQLTLLLSLS